ncbi:MAG: di-heme oxidoredictase family protein [Crocinitomicaceae bacterium]
MKKTVLFLTTGIILFSGSGLNSCKKDSISEPQEDERLGGDLTVYDFSTNAFSLPAPALGGLDELHFFVGNSFFNQNWVTAPSSTTARDGLGPLFNARNCSGCHFKDGRGTPILPGMSGTEGFLMRLSIGGTDVHGGPNPDPNYGGQLNDKSIQGVLPEAEINVSFNLISGNYPDGSAYELREPIYTISNLNYGSLDPGILFSPRVGNQMIGLGLLEAISEADIIAHADEWDLNGDEISGKPNYVWDYIENNQKIGRFGWKANQPSLKQQVAGAFLGDIGITTSLFSTENCTSPQQDCLNAANGGTPELEDEDLDKVVLYASSLAVPARRNIDNPNVIRGKELFFKVGCQSCHTYTFTTGIHPNFSHLSNQKIFPFTDLLLHDMGSGLTDHRPDYLANGNEWRTPPLWGIGLFETVNGHTYYLHDGRARNLEEAILWHGGESITVIDRFKNLPKSDRSSLIEFLKTL